MADSIELIPCETARPPIWAMSEPIPDDDDGGAGRAGAVPLPAPAGFRRIK